MQHYTHNTQIQGVDKYRQTHRYTHRERDKHTHMAHALFIARTQKHAVISVDAQHTGDYHPYPVHVIMDEMKVMAESMKCQIKTKVMRV